MQRLFLTILLLGCWLSPAGAVELRLMTGPENGTYYQIGQEASTVTDRTGVHLQVLPSLSIYPGDFDSLVFGRLF